ncbi:MAG TPA: methyltransferase domain-containing protein [Gemmatimonadaceae bacterium]|nr:methyltransferase domain-containing protein [Gemmatimonadaceae bacterium]
MSARQFNREYYRRFYENPTTAIISAAERRNEIRFVLSFCRHIGLEVRRFSDVGAGTGWWAREFRRQYRSCRHIETFDSSGEAARIYGHRQVRAQEIAGLPSDLVVCRDVLRYLADRQAKRAIARLAAKCRGVLYFQVVTSDDEVDEDRSDMTGYFRPASWYRRSLERAGFTDAGMGLFVSDRFSRFDPFALELR